MRWRLLGVEEVAGPKGLSGIKFSAKLSNITKREGGALVDHALSPVVQHGVYRCIFTSSIGFLP